MREAERAVSESLGLITPSMAIRFGYLQLFKYRL